MDGSRFNPRQLNPPGFAWQNTGTNVAQQADAASPQADFEQQLNQLQPGSSEESAGRPQSTLLDVSRPVPSLPDLRDDFIPCHQTSEAAAHGPGPGSNSQPEFAVNKKVRAGAKRGRSEPFPEDEELVSTFKNVAREKMHQRAVQELGSDLHHLSRWLRQENRRPIFDRFNHDSPGHASFVADVQDYLRAGGRSIIVTHLKKVAPWALPSRVELTGELPPRIGRRRKLAPHPEDAPLIEGALGQTLKDLGALDLEAVCIGGTFRNFPPATVHRIARIKSLSTYDWRFS
ncbi:hypothetical protein [Mesorhizobium sp. WSM3224]|uniref:hypothetical protein n=1 Tax=Mesorhizobium sp. WSM3224 TaxID=1040986 RepID=UPI000481AB00|nr:hypothetical protein [Mesorhizobium sp. WSM3224]